MWCSYGIKDHFPQYIAYKKHTREGRIHDIDNFEIIIDGLEMDDFSFGNPNKENFFLRDGYSIIERSISNNAVLGQYDHSSQIQFIFANGFVADNVIFKHYSESNPFFSNKEIIDVKAYNDSNLILCSDGIIYAFVEDPDREALEPYFGAIPCGFSASSTPCSIYGSNDLPADSFDIASDGTLTFISNANKVYSAFSNSRIEYKTDMSKLVRQHHDLNILFISQEGVLYSTKYYPNERRHAYFRNEYSDFTERYPSRVDDVKVVKGTDASEMILLTKDNKVYTVAQNDMFLRGGPFETENFIDVTYISVGGYRQFFAITENSLYFSETNTIIPFPNSVLEKVETRSRSDNEAEAFIKTKDNTLIFVKFDLSANLVLKNVELKDYYIEDIYRSIIKIRKDNSFEYYFIGYNLNFKFGYVHNNDPYIYQDEITVGDGIAKSDFEPHFKRISFPKLSGSIDVSDIKMTCFGAESSYVLTKDNELYGRGTNINKALGLNVGVNSPRFVKITGLFNDQKICNLYCSGSTSLLYLKTCNGKLYQQGFFNRNLLRYADDNKIYSRYINNYPSYEVTEAKSVKYLRFAGLSPGAAYFLYDTDIPICMDEGECQIDEDKEIIGEDIVFKDEGTTITSNLTIVDGNVIIHHPQEEKAPIIVDGGTLVLNSTKLTFEINYQEVYDAIKDGQRVVIIDTKGNGEIDGAFDDIELKLVDINDECKTIEGELDQTSEQISIVFKVKEICSGFPIWAIIVIVLGCIIIIVIVVILVYLRVIRKGNFKSKKDTRDRMTNGGNHDEEKLSQGKNEMYSGKSKTNPTYTASN